MRTKPFWIITLFVVSFSATALASQRDLILTTDCGTEIDDQWAIAYLFVSPELNVKGIVTTHAPNLPEPKSEASASCVREVLRRLDIKKPPPVFAGSSVALNKPKPLINPGVELILNTSRLYSGKSRLLILTIGATTDVGSAFLADPELAGRVEAVTMGYKSWEIAKEWNIQNDAIAANAILQSGAPLTIGSADVCRTHLTLDAATVRKGSVRGHGAVGTWLSDLYLDWIKKEADLVAQVTGHQKWVIWDAIVVGHLLGFTRTETRARPKLKTEDVTFIHDSAGTLNWITSLDERQMWADFITKLDAHSARKSAAAAR